MMLNLLSFDYGASSGRAMLGQFDGSKLSLTEIHRYLNEPVQLGDSLYWDFLRLFHEMKQGILKTANAGYKNIASIGIDTWGVDFGLLDSKGKLLGNPFHYRDSNTQGMMEEAFKLASQDEIYRTTGIAFQTFNSLYQLLSLKVNKSPLLENASTLLFIPDLFRYFLTGEKSCEFTIASTAQMLDAATGNWATELLEKLGLPINILPKIVPAGSIQGKLTDRLASELGIGNVPVVAVAEHDTGSAVVSVPANSDKFAYLSSGTWSLLGVESTKPVISEDAFKMNYTNEGGYNGTTRLLKNIMGLWIYQECKRAWDKTGEIVSFDELEAEAAKSEPFMCLIDVDNSVFYSPGNMPNKIRTFCKETGQRVPETKGQIVRCIMESLALKYRMALEGLEKLVGHRLPVLHIVGGGCKNKLLSQFTANAIGRPVLAGPVEATAIGNLAVQLIALGEVKNIEEARKLVKNSFPLDEYEPKDMEVWDEAYGNASIMR